MQNISHDARDITTSDGQNTLRRSVSNHANDFDDTISLKQIGTKDLYIDCNNESKKIFHMNAFRDTW